MTGAAERIPAGRRGEVLGVLRDSGGPLGVAEIAGRLGVHPNTVRFHLSALAAAGLAERVDAGSAGPGRPPLAYRIRRDADPAGPRGYHLLAAVLAGGLAAGPDPAREAAQAGRAWGTGLAARAAADGAAAGQPAGMLLGLLGELGFAPEVQDGGQRIGLRHCPFLELASSRPDVVCPVHLGLMQGALGAAGSPVTVTRLEPFAEPGLCLAHLGTVA